MNDGNRAQGTPPGWPQITPTKTRDPAPRALVVGFVATVVTVVAVVLAVFAVDARAYEVHGFRWETAVVGYDAAPSLQPYPGAGARTWESVSGLRFGAGTQIRVVAGPLLPPIDHPGQAAQANVVQSGGVLESCEIRVDPAEFSRLSEAGRHTVLAHEFGHSSGSTIRQGRAS